MIDYIESSEFYVSALTSLLLSVFLRETVRFSSDSTGVKDISAQRVLLLLPEGFQNVKQSVAFPGPYLIATSFV